MTEYILKMTSGYIVVEAESAEDAAHQTISLFVDKPGLHIENEDFDITIGKTGQSLEWNHEEVYKRIYKDRRKKQEK